MKSESSSVKRAPFVGYLAIDKSPAQGDMVLPHKGLGPNVRCVLKETTKWRPVLGSSVEV